MQVQAEKDGVVYLIDDDPHVRSGLANLLRSVGLKAEVFGSAAEFLRIERQARPCCVVLDVRLPGLGGLDFQAELARRQHSPPIVFITGYGDIPMTVRAMRYAVSPLRPCKACRTIASWSRRCSPTI